MLYYVGVCLLSNLVILTRLKFLIFIKQFKNFDSFFPLINVNLYFKKSIIKQVTKAFAVVSVFRKSGALS